MNKFLSILFSTVAALALLASCDLNKAPEFDDSMSYVSFSTPTITVSEDKGTITLPVQMATLSAKATNVTYAVVEDDSPTAAVEGTDFTFSDASGVLAFDGEALTGGIEINILPHPGVYTGDKTFTVELTNATGMNVGADNKCIIKILDMDHPLADILGSYTVKGTDQFAGGVEYTMNLLKDPKDVTVVWCDAICQLASSVRGRLNVYGNVSEDHNTITFPCGQDTGLDNGDGNLIFCITTYTGGKYYANDEGEVVFTKTADGVYTSTHGMGFVDNKYVYTGGFMLGADTDPSYFTTWTKQ